MADERPDIGTILGRIKPESLKPTPEAPASSPEDFAPKQKAPPIEPAREEASIAQAIKYQIRTASRWGYMSPGECEALDQIATSIARIMVGRNAYWKQIAEDATIGEEACDNA